MPAIKSTRPSGIAALLHLDTNVLTNSIVGGLAFEAVGTPAIVTTGQVFGAGRASFNGASGFIRSTTGVTLAGEFFLGMRFERNSNLGRYFSIGTMGVDFGFGMDSYVNNSTLERYSAASNSALISDSANALNTVNEFLCIMRTADGKIHFTVDGAEVQPAVTDTTVFSGKLTLGACADSPTTYTGSACFMDEVLLHTTSSVYSTFPHAVPNAAWTYTS